MRGRARARFPATDIYLSREDIFSLTGSPRFVPYKYITVCVRVKSVSSRIMIAVDCTHSRVALGELDGALDGALDAALAVAGPASPLAAVGHIC